MDLQRDGENAIVIANNVHARFACPYVPQSIIIVRRLGEYASIKKNAADLVCPRDARFPGTTERMTFFKMSQLFELLTAKTVRW